MIFLHFRRYAMLISMTVTKYLHSCLLVEEGGKRLLIDPGSFSFIEGLLKPQDIPQPQAVFVTHEHPDHFFPDALHRYVERGARLWTNASAAERCRERGIAATVLPPGTNVEIVPFLVEAFAAPHGELPIPKPDNVAFLVNRRFLHPGDSLHPALAEAKPELLALPVAAPWLTLKDALDFAVAVKPKTVIPIHDAFVKDFFLKRMYETAKTYLTPHGIAFAPLGLGESLTIS